jgi:L,D-peptidoglycan transpeptidase YkuD (ErfK/YbiS/YcfS/YnhG family)
MPHGRHRSREEEERANKILGISVLGLLLLMLGALIVLTLRPPQSTEAIVQPSADTTAAKSSVAATTQAAVPSQRPPVKAGSGGGEVRDEAEQTSPPTPAASGSQPKTLPEQMDHTLPGSTQMIVITGARLGSNSGTLELYNKDDGHWARVMSTPANFGKNGLVNGETRTSGHLQTPTGIWSIGSFVFGQQGSAPSGTKMPYRAITSKSWWSSQHDSTYNTWVTSTSHIDGEHLADARVQYEYAFDTGYNAPPNERVMGRGTAIFIHCFEPPGNSLGAYTHGCIAIHREQMVKLFELLEPGRTPSCAIGTTQKGSGTSIWAY